jgi:hypothetical protein
MKIFQKLSKLLMKPLALLENKYVAGALKIFLILYAATIAPKLPNFLVKALKNPVVKLLVLFLIAYTGVKDPIMSLLIAIGFVVSMQTLIAMEASNSLDGMIKSAVDVPQSLLNEVVDGAQTLAMDGANMVGSPVTDVVGTANKLVDAVQDVANKVIDGAQDLVPSISIGKSEKKENFSMEDRTLDVSVPDMGTLDGLSGFDGAEVGASVEFTEPAALQ